MAKVCGFQIGKQICEALGLDAKKVRAIDIHIKTRELVTATVEHYVTGEQVDSLTTVLSSYSLASREDLTQEPVAKGDDITPLGEGEALMQFFKGKG
jgi:hypothetical protein